nr:immunoglobulin light chain junction region [Macaca mulatta]MPO07484.1 immunoglobulin light chain junction region [Macaca mulatta]MPO07953.1 immunoglobulin light chain junction region [Macaca mulatta]MPO08120.1 immunoglobulin light chain junction region [Macaca mulatta]MPO09608.1 immunoglobulin light chain junction region [Macaca mulatta]
CSAWDISLSVLF